MALPAVARAAPSQESGIRTRKTKENSTRIRPLPKADVDLDQIQTNLARSKRSRSKRIESPPDRTGLVRKPALGGLPMSGSISPQLTCLNCGNSLFDVPEIPIRRPWHVLGRVAVRSYVASLGHEVHEWLLALFVDSGYSLLAVDTIAKGGVSDVEVNFGRILFRGHQLGAAGFILVHNHPSGDPTPSQADIRITARLAHVSRDLDIPLIDHLIVAGDAMRSCGWF